MSKHSRIQFAMPAGATDCHTHVFGLPQDFPYAADRQYTPDVASAADMLAVHQQLGIQRVVIVQPSPYGADNACTLDGMAQLSAAGHAARGVAVISPTTTDADLQAMHAAGMRGIRLNLETSGVRGGDAATQALRWAAQRVAHLGWHLQMYSNLSVVASLASEIEQLKMPLVVDHFCKADAALGITQPHFGVLLRLVETGKVWVKLSAPHRVSSLPDCEDAAALARALIAAHPEHMLWGSDWPHPGARAGHARRVDEVERFNPIDDGRALNRLHEWVADATQLRKILVDNPAQLYDF